MKLLIDIPETQYNNIMEIKSMNLGRIPYKGIVMNTIRGIQNGTPIPDNATVCDIDAIKAEIKAIDVTMGIKDYPFIPKVKVLNVIDKYKGGITHDTI